MNKLLKIFFFLPLPKLNTLLFVFLIKYKIDLSIALQI